MFCQNNEFTLVMWQFLNMAYHIVSKDLYGMDIFESYYPHFYQSTLYITK